MRGNGFKLKDSQVQIRQKEEISYDEGGQTVEPVAQRSCGCPIWDSTDAKIRNPSKRLNTQMLQEQEKNRTVVLVLQMGNWEMTCPK